MDIQRRSNTSPGVWDCGNNTDMVESDEENGAVSSSSAAERVFNAVLGCIEDISTEEDFQQLQQKFMEKHYLEFDDSDENKLIYTSIFNDYIDLLEKHLEQQLTERIPGFNMSAFNELVKQRKEEVPGDIFDLLLTFTDFMAFKEMFVAYRAEKEGRGPDWGEGRWSHLWSGQTAKDTSE